MPAVTRKKEAVFHKLIHRFVEAMDAVAVVIAECVPANRVATPLVLSLKLVEQAD
jgi:hypothetical protein